MKSESGKQEIIIVGAGIIGVCTAYYLTQHPLFDAKLHHITIFEARRPASGASGKAGGLLALWAFPRQIVPLSFDLHQQLAEMYNGEQEWGYRRLNTMSVQGSLHKRGKSAPSKTKLISGCKDLGGSSTSESSGLGSGSSSSSSTPQEKGKGTRRVKKSDTAQRGPAAHSLPEGLNWIRPEIVDGWSSLGGTDTTAQVHPYKFTMALLRRVLDTGAAELITGKVVKLTKDAETSKANGVIYEVEDKNEKSTKTLYGDQVVLTLGPWTSRILKSCPISGLRAHSITIRPSRETSPFAMFTEMRTKSGSYVSPEIYPRKDEVYICGEGDTSVPLPETTEEVEVEIDRCNDLAHYAGQISDELEQGKVLRRQACYLPVTDIPSCSGPFIGETNVENLFLASGHSCWGINNAPGTGKLMSEILLEGKAHSASLAGLEPRAFFDASDFAC